ncbi:hypothetical protein BJV82DRAFT_602519 [Fennellomyces sp. T-0311]|nr:hypothetical protein BJV82DRAFT_602519 [Fennellomyces sp. T-0311]
MSLTLNNTLLAKPVTKDCDGRNVLGKRHSFDQDRNGAFHSMHTRDSNTSQAYKSYGVKPSASYSMPINSPSQMLPPPGPDEEDRLKLMRDIIQAKEELLRFRNEMDGLAEQIGDMEIDLKDSKDRVCTYSQKLAEIEHDLTTTQEVNVDLQVLLENAVKTQKESDGRTTHMIRNMHSNLANIVYENSQLQERLASLALHQEKYHGNVVDVGEKMREYAHMLEQAQGTIQILQAPRHSRPMRTREDIMNALSIRDGLSSRRGSDISSIYMTEDDEVSGIASRKQSETTTLLTAPSPDRPGSISPDIAELYRHRIIRKRPSLPGGLSPLFTPTYVSRANEKKKAVDDTFEGPSNSPQQGLRLLLRNQGGHGLGLSSLADSKR